MANKKEKNTKTKPNPFAWFIYSTASKLIMFIKNHVKYDKKAYKKRDKSRGCIVLYNHASKKDHFITSAAFGSSRVNYVITNHFYYNKVLRTVLTWVRAIPREQFKSDLISIRKIKKVIDNKGTICIAPAGQMTIHGGVTYIDPAIVKLIKFCKADIYTCQMHGTYLAYPKWRKNERKFPIHAKFLKVMSKEELQTLSEDEIYERAVKAIDVFDLRDQKENPIKIKGQNLIEGLEQIIYYCPKCKSKHTISTKGNLMTCSRCNNTVKMNEYGFLEPVGHDCVMFQNEVEWYNYEKSVLKEEILKGGFRLEGNFTLTCNVEDGNWELEEVGQGKVVLTNDEMYYEGTFKGQTVLKKFPLENLIQLPFDAGSRFDIPNDEGTYQFRPIDNPAKVVEFVQAVDVMREIRIGH